MLSVFPKLPQIWETQTSPIYQGNHEHCSVFNVKIIQESFVGLCEYEIGWSK